MWKYTSPREPGLHSVIDNHNSECKSARFLRLNLSAGQDYMLESGVLEMNTALISGEAAVTSDYFNQSMRKLDSFYIPGNSRVHIRALSSIIFYIGAAVCEGIGVPVFQKYQPALPLGEVRQVHGKGVFRRDVFMTLNPEIPASRLICGYTWGTDGGWTSWPPHQHENDLEEIYCYFDMPGPQFGLHLSYTEPGVSSLTVHVVREGNAVIAPRGYHPTVASPGTRSTYFWILAAFTPQNRRYDLAKPDVNFCDVE